MAVEKHGRNAAFGTTTLRIEPDVGLADSALGWTFDRLPF